MKYTIAALTLAVCAFLTSESYAQTDTKQMRKRKGKKETIREDKYADIVKKCKKFDGLIVLYRDTVTGKSYIEISEEQLGKEFIYFNHVADAAVESGYFRGSFGSSKIIRFEKVFDKIDILQENTSYYFDPSTELSRSAGANVNDPLIASEKIEAIHKDKKKYLVDGDAVFLSEKLQLIKRPSPPGATPGPLGTLSASKTRLDSINNYPENTELIVSYVYENTNPPVFTDALADPRNITIRYQHTILGMPQDNFNPRADDPRVGYFTTQVNDMTSYSATPFRDMIHRWRLEKKYPDSTLSEPVKPITFWIENTTPREFRPIIKESCERWNIAFEKAGFKNAVVCLEQPDDATWDAGDIRYNVLRWTSSPDPLFGGYGPSFVNPRTGEILGADIMLEFVAITNRVKAEMVFKTTGFMTDESLNAQSAQFIGHPYSCFASDMTNHDLLFGNTVASVMGMDEIAKKEIVKQLLGRLILHEVGHTLGLTHNMRASTLHTVEEIKNPEKIRKEGLANSVMEYPAFNYQLKPEHQSIFCDDKPGPYDLWVIEYGYSTSLSDSLMEADRLKMITDRSANHDLAYGNDADDMRSSGRGIDPDVNIYDLSSDPVQYAMERCELVNAVLPGLKDHIQKNNRSYQELLQSFLIATGEYAIQLRVMTRQIGGVHFDRSFAGQETKHLPFEPVSEEKQRAAMKALEKYAFAPDILEKSNLLLSYLLQQRRGFDHFSNNQDPKIHDRILTMQEECLNHLLHRAVLQRITDSKLYGNTYTLDEVLTDLTNSIFLADQKGSVNTVRQNLQVEYTQRLVKIMDPAIGYDNVSVGMAIAELKRIDQMQAAAAAPDGLTKAHREHLRTIIKKAFES
ncbi:MAG: zinc-dependent metalloprotease [Crocinitomicaceae bacterium]|nr:zinc-dependent metalloprotease [Crocinitomicaceae bacterium]